MLGLLVMQLLFSLVLSSKHVAIVGSGISGATAAYTLRAAHPMEELEIVVFEKEERVGGRMTNIEIEGTVVEVGASVFHIVNEKLVNYSSHFGIETEKYKNKHLVEGNLGIWDGSIFRFWESTWPLLPKVQAVMRYGLSPLRLAREVDVMLPAFKGIYEVGPSLTHLLSTLPAAGCTSHGYTLLQHLTMGEAYATPGELFSSLSHLWSTTIGDFLGTPSAQGSALDAGFLSEIITAVNRINYGQDNSLNALAGMVSIVGAEPELFSIKSGNKNLVSALLKAAGAQVETGVPVTRIERVDVGGPGQGGRRTLSVQPTQSYYINGDEKRAFDAVIFAAPLEFSLGKGELDLSENIIAAFPPGVGAREYQSTVVTLVVGRLNATFFDPTLEAFASLPSTIGTVEDSSIPFSSVGMVGETDTADPKPIYKMFSRFAPTPDLLSRVFREHEVRHSIPIKAYPILTTAVATAALPFELGPAFYYPAALESLVSTMETQSISGHNAANMLSKHWLQCEV